MARMVLGLVDFPSRAPSLLVTLAMTLALSDDETQVMTADGGRACQRGRTFTCRWPAV
jgi:hypothetical protein